MATTTAGPSTQPTPQPTGQTAAQTGATPDLEAAKKKKEDEEEKEKERLRLSGVPLVAKLMTIDADRSTVVFRRFDQPAIRNLLYLEGRVAALDLVQRAMDEEDTRFFSEDEAITRAAQSWEDFALLGCSEAEMKELSYPAMAHFVEGRYYAALVRINELKSIRDPAASVSDEERARATRLLAWPEQVGFLDKLEAIVNDLQKQLRGRKDEGDRLEETLREAREVLGFTMGQELRVRYRWQVAQALKVALKDYEEALLRYRDLLALQRPAKRSEKTLRGWLEGRTEGVSEQFLYGTGLASAYSEENGSRDLVGLGLVGAKDALSRLIARWVTGNSLLSTLGEDRTIHVQKILYIREGFVDKIVTAIVVFVAGVWVVGAIWFLWLVQEKQPWESAQLGLLTFFIASFALLLNFGTVASRDQVFGATAAYAAVLVVFIGTRDTK